MDFLSWLGGGGGASSKTSTPELTALQVLRNKHIEELKSSSLRLIEFEKDSKYQINMDEKSEFSLNLYLTPMFPQEKPIIHLSEPLKHPWLDADGLTVVNCPSLNNFSVHSNLGRIIREIADELGQFYNQSKFNIQNFQLNQYKLPQKQTQQSTTMGFPVESIYNPQQFDEAMHLSMLPQQQQQQNVSFPQQNLVANTSSTSSSTSINPPSDTALGDCNYGEITSVQDLDKLSSGEIISILRDGDKLERLTMACHKKQIDAYAHRLETMEQQIESLAESNMKMKKDMEFRKSKCIETHDRWSKMKERLSSTWKQFEEQSSSSPLLSNQSLLLDNLKVVTMEAEEEADAIADDFVQDKMAVDLFVSNFLEKRNIFHKRKIKEERLSYLMDNGLLFL